MYKAFFIAKKVENTFELSLNKLPLQPEKEG